VAETVMVIEDEKEIRELIRYNLERAGYRVHAVADGDEGLQQLFSSRPDALVLDLMLPGRSGLEVLRELRGEPSTHDMPVVVLTARSAEMDKLLGFEHGADDYLTKPFSPRTLIARVRALLRRAGIEVSGRTEVGDLVLEADTLTLRLGAARSVRVTRLEFRLLQLLFAHAGQPVHTDRLLAHVWGHKGGGDRQVLKQLVHRLRLKLGEDTETGSRVETVPAVGYRLNTSGTTARGG